MENCRFFLQGRCRKGDSCKFRHEHTPFALTTVPDSRQTDLEHQTSKKPCIYWLQGTCRNGHQCGFAHDQRVKTPQQDGVTEKDLRSLVKCKFFLQGKCKRGRECPYRHPADKEQGEPTAESDNDSFRRAFSGALVCFADGAAVSSVALAAEFSTVRLAGLPPGSTATSTAGLLHDFGHDVQVNDIHLSSEGNDKLVNATITVRNSSFAKRLCTQIKESTNQAHAYFHALPVPPRLPGWAASRRMSRRKVIITWKQLTRIARLRFPASDLSARITSDRFNEGTYKICGLKVTASAPIEDDASQTVVLRHVPYNATQNDIQAAISVQALVTLEKIELDKPSKSYTIGSATAMIEFLLSKIGPSDFSIVNGPYTRYAKAVATFMDESDAQESVKVLDGQPQSFLNDKALSLQLISTSSIIVPVRVYDAVEDQLAASTLKGTEQNIVYNVYKDPNRLRRFVTLKVEGPDEKDVAKAAAVIEDITAGRVIKDGEANFWLPRLKYGGLETQILKDIELRYGVLIVRHKPKRQLQYFGRPEKLHDVTRDILDWLKVEGEGIESPAVVEHEDISQSAPDSCPICFSEAQEVENPVTLECGHTYCQDCFEGLCSSTDTGAREFMIVCAGTAGEECNKQIPLAEMKTNLPSAIFEEVLCTSFAAYIRRRQNEFRYCPTPDCGSIFRIVKDEYLSARCACQKCAVVFCLDCYNQHNTTMSCEEAKDLASGGYGAFEMFKKTANVKDCPQCSTPIEKIDGCNHMTCGGCKAQICWECMTAFDTSEAVYIHMNRDHGGIGIPGADDETDEEDNWLG